MLLLSNYISLV